MSGHNKWSQIKVKKGKEDAKKSQVFSLLARQISLEAKKSGGDKNSPSLRAAIERARAANIPKDTIERAIEKGVGANVESLAEVIYEAYGPSGAALIIEGITDSKNRTTQEIKHLLTEHGGALANHGAVTWAFVKNENGWRPRAIVVPSPQNSELVERLVKILLNHPDVKNVYSNVA